MWHTDLLQPDFAAFARSCGAVGILVEPPADPDVSPSSALAGTEPALVEVITDSELT